MLMDRHDFLTELLAVFPPDKNYEAVYRFYDNTLPASETCDYKQLLKIVGQEYKYKSTPPTSWLLDNVSRCKYFGECEGIDFEELKTVKIMKYGCEYEFTIVPEGWGSKTRHESEIRRSIEDDTRV